MGLDFLRQVMLFVDMDFLSGGGGLTWFTDAADQNMSVFVWEEPLRFEGLGKFLVYEDYCYGCLILKFIYEISFSRFFLLSFIECKIRRMYNRNDVFWNFSCIPIVESVIPVFIYSSI